jgi:bifunctional DNase/RNase
VNERIERVKLNVQGLTNSQMQSGAYALILAEEKGLRRIPIIVGMAEAQSIAIALERIVPPRPLTHDLFATLFQMVEITLLEVYIHKFEDGVFFSEMVFERPNGERIVLDSRTSDAIAIALRVNCDVFTTRRIVHECGVLLDEAPSPDDDDEDDDDDEYDTEEDDDDTLEGIPDEAQAERRLAQMDAADLKRRLEDAIRQENYEQAKNYRDELRRRDKK